MFKLFLPIRQHTTRSDNQEGAIFLFELYEVGNECNCLNCLSETHLVSQDAVEIVIVERYEPL